MSIKIKSTPESRFTNLKDYILIKNHEGSIKSIKTKIRIRKLSELRKSAANLPSCVEGHVKKVSKMDKKTYLKYYISVLEKQIREATKILRIKKDELRRLR